MAVLGTGTGVGKTWVAAALLTRLRAEGLRVAARKPAQSFAPGERTDAEILGQASGEAPAEVCPRTAGTSARWPRRWPPSPWGGPAFTIADLAATSWSGPRAPMSGWSRARGASAPRWPPTAMPSTFSPPSSPTLVVLVADAGLGTLSLVRMAADALRGWPLIVYLNGFEAGDELHGRNRDWLVGRAGLRVASSIDQLLPLPGCGPACPTDL